MTISGCLCITDRACIRRCPCGTGRRKEELNEQLVWLREHPDARERVTVTYFRPDAKKAGGVYVTVTGAVKKIDEYEKTLWMEDGTVIAIEELSAVEIPGKDRYEEE